MLRLTAFVNGVYTDSACCSTFEKAEGSLVILPSEGLHAGDKVIVSLRTKTRRSPKLIAEVGQAVAQSWSAICTGLVVLAHKEFVACR